MCGYFYLSNEKTDLKYFKRKAQIDDLSNAFEKIGPKSLKSQKTTSIKKDIISNESFTSFLKKNNPYHILLSYKIENERKSVTDNDSYFSYEDQQLRDYEKTHGLKYSTELALILKNGNFTNHNKEEFFILNEYALFEPEEVINIIEMKVVNSINTINKDPNLDDTYFTAILSKYYEKIVQNDIDKLERKRLLENIIKAPKLSVILKTIWK